MLSSKRCGGEHQNFPGWLARPPPWPLFWRSGYERISARSRTKKSSSLQLHFKLSSSCLRAVKKGASAASGTVRSEGGKRRSGRVCQKVEHTHVMMRAITPSSVASFTPVEIKLRRKLREQLLESVRKSLEQIGCCGFTPSEHGARSCAWDGNLLFAHAKNV